MTFDTGNRNEQVYLNNIARCANALEKIAVTFELIYEAIEEEDQKTADDLDEHPDAPVCQCWNEGQYGRVHREHCPVHREAP